MTLQKGICEECGKEYEEEYHPRFPRKYCRECSAKKKAKYEKLIPLNRREEEEMKVPVVRPGELAVQKSTANVPPYNKNTTMYVSYAKDIFCELVKAGSDNDEALMKISIELVKQAQKEFS